MTHHTGHHPHEIHFWNQTSSVYVQMVRGLASGRVNLIRYEQRPLCSYLTQLVRKRVSARKLACCQSQFQFQFQNSISSTNVIFILRTNIRTTESQSQPRQVIGSWGAQTLTSMRKGRAVV